MLSKDYLFDRYVRDRYPGVTPLTWDDEFRDLTAPELVEWGIAKLLEPVIWKYTPDIASYIAPEVCCCSQYSTLAVTLYLFSSISE
jgi:hypothetical protein